MIRFHALWRPQIVAAPHNTDSPFFCLAAQFHRMEVHSFSPKFSSDTVDIFGKDPTVSQRFLFFLFLLYHYFWGAFLPLLDSDGWRGSKLGERESYNTHESLLCLESRRWRCLLCGSSPQSSSQLISYSSSVSGRKLQTLKRPPPLSHSISFAWEWLCGHVSNNT